MRRLVRTACLGGLAALLVATGMPAPRADDDMAKIIEYRQRLFKASAEHAISIGMILKGEVPFDARHIQWHAEALYAMSKLIIQCFPKGSGSAAGKTEAKDEIWANWDKFMADAVDLERETAKLVEIAKTGDMKATQAQMVIVGKGSCTDCHDEFVKSGN
ncbi:MAG: c-type cytochrome [Alphaproteobacteria bacterium]